MSRAQKIARLNDLLRTTFLCGRVVLTEGVASLSDIDREAILTAVREFSDFTPDNDPYGEHDFGAIDHPNVGKVFWKIDYYDLTGTVHSPDPSDPKLTARVLTIMFASEY